MNISVFEWFLLFMAVVLVWAIVDSYRGGPDGNQQSDD